MLACKRWSLRSHRVYPPQTALSAIAELPIIQFITQEQPVLLSVNSDFEQLWAVAFLKAIPLVLDQPRSYLAMPHVLPLLAKARPAPVHKGYWYYVPARIRMLSGTTSIMRFSVDLEAYMLFIRNVLADICERIPGGDVDVVTSALGLDSRIGRKYLTGALGYGGPCFPRDNVALGFMVRARYRGNARRGNG